LKSSERQRIVLGLDLSTQSLSASAIEIDSCRKIYDSCVNFVKDPRLALFGLNSDNYILPTSIDGEACQPVRMYLAALDALFSDIARAGFPLQNVVVINISGQQHGQVYLNHQANAVFACLHDATSTTNSLTSLLGNSLAFDLAPIWMTSNTREQADFMRNHVSGKNRMIKLSGSDVPLRFSGPIIRRIGQTMPEIYLNTWKIHLISSFITAVLTGNSNVPIDFGNACGMSLMNYSRKSWSASLITAASSGLPGSEIAFRKRLPDIVEPTAIVGSIAGYFIVKYGFRPDCKIAAGSGDNPQSKVLVRGDLLSLGSSIVYMSSTNGKTRDWSGMANAMYDGISRPFIFSCRTNGALVWDYLRVKRGLNREAYVEAEEMLRRARIGSDPVFWQPRSESFPPSGSYDLVRSENASPELESDYSGLIETTLAAMYFHSRSFSKPTRSPLFITGGAAASREIIRRVSAIWDRPVIRLESLNTTAGAAVSGIYAYFKSNNQAFDVEQFSSNLLKKEAEFSRIPEDIHVFHNPGGFLDRFIQEEQRLLEKFPLK